jgi:hypothetical protein
MKFIKFVCVAIFQNKTLLWKILKTVKSNIIFHKYPENKTLLWKILKTVKSNIIFHKYPENKYLFGG